MGLFVNGSFCTDKESAGSAERIGAALLAIAIPDAALVVFSLVRALATAVASDGCAVNAEVKIFPENQLTDFAGHAASQLVLIKTNRSLLAQQSKFTGDS
jgi:hypothetical protein